MADGELEDGWRMVGGGLEECCVRAGGLDEDWKSVVCGG